MSERVEGYSHHADLQNEIAIPKVRLGFYRHHKGKNYLVVGLGRHSETEEIGVVYVPLYFHPGPLFAFRPVEMFVQDLPLDGVQQPRFKYLGWNPLSLLR